MFDLLIVLKLLRFIITATAACAGSFGVCALVFSALHPNPEAAFFASFALISAIAMTLGLPDEGRL